MRLCKGGPAPYEDVSIQAYENTTIHKYSLLYTNKSIHYQLYKYIMEYILLFG